MAEEHQQAIEVESVDGQTFTFATRNEAIEYASRERAKWNWLTQSNGARSYGDVLVSLLSITDALESVIQQVKSVASAASNAAVCRGLQAYVDWMPSIHDRAPLQGYLVQIANRSEKEALWTLAWIAYRTGKLPNLEVALNAYWNSPGYLSGMTSAWVWAERALKADGADSVLARVKQVAAETQALRDQAQAAMATINELASTIIGLTESGKAMVATTNEGLQNFARTLDATLGETLTTQTMGLQKRWQDLTATYEESLKLKAPAKYWALKQRSHRNQSIGFGLAAAVFAIAVGYGMCVGFYRLMANVPANTIMPPWQDVLPSVVIAVLFLWGLRTLVRLAMSHVHLALDAGERRIMVQCYLAMTHKGETTGEERGALFAAIFRSSGDGIVKDEAPPIPMWEMLKATKTKPD